MRNKFILGTVQLGKNYGINNLSGMPSESMAFNILNTAYSLGIDTLDTAGSYGSALEIIGKYHKNSHKFNVINKIVHTFQNLKTDLTRDLAILGIPYFQAILLHDYKDLKNKDFLKQLKGLKDERLMLKIGVSIYNNFEFELAIQTAEIDIIQLPFNLFDNYTRRGGLIQKAKNRNIEIHVRSVFLQGLFYKDPESLTGNLKTFKKPLFDLREIAVNNNIRISTLALAYVCGVQEIDKIIIGVDSADQLTQNVVDLEYPITLSLINEIEKIKIEDETLLSPVFWQP